MQQNEIEWNESYNIMGFRPENSDDYNHRITKKESPQKLVTYGTRIDCLIEWGQFRPKGFDASPVVNIQRILDSLALKMGTRYDNIKHVILYRK